MSAAEFPHQIPATQLLEMFGSPAAVPAFFTEYYSRIDTAWRYPTPQEERVYTHNILRRILHTRKSHDRAANYQAFNEGWRENLERVQRDGVSMETVKPGYYRGVRYLLFGGELIIPRNPQLNYDLAILCATLIFSQHLSGFRTICEFGCGSGLNLYLLHRLFPETEIVGLDWCETAAGIVQVMHERLSPRIHGGQFDLLEPAKPVFGGEGVAFLTYTAMEQVGTDFGPFLDYIRQSAPASVVHWEPFCECYDEDNYWSLLSHQYCAGRGYLNGLHRQITALAGQGLARIDTDCCPGPGGEYYQPQLLVWTPQPQS